MKKLKKIGKKLGKYFERRVYGEKNNIIDAWERDFENFSVALRDVLFEPGFSRSQLGQDLFVLSETNMKRDGYFVEFGATNGYDLSNTFLLEKKFGWTGILAEPATVWHDELISNRSAAIEKNCVWRTSGEKLSFSMANVAELSTITDFINVDKHAKYRKNVISYEVETISLNDLLEKYEAPRNIDYLSIDTEGSELDILSSFDFKKYDVAIITCEHNFTPAREMIFELLTGKGYVRKFESLSKFDDWYVKRG